MPDQVPEPEPEPEPGAGACSTMGASESQPAPDPVQPPPAQHPPAGPTPSANPGQLVTVSVRCPPGVGPGDTVRIPSGGQQFDVKVPAGITPNSVFQVQLPGQQPAAAPGGDVYSGGAQYPGLQSAASVAPQARAPRQPDVLDVHAPPPAPTAKVQSEKLDMALALQADSVRLEGSTLSLRVTLGVPARLTAWQGVQFASNGVPPPPPGELGAVATAGQVPGAARELPAGAAACKVEVVLDLDAISKLRSEAPQLCSVVICLEAIEGGGGSEAPVPAGVTVRALMVWLDPENSSCRVRAQHIFTSAGQVIPLDVIYGASDEAGDSQEDNMCIICYDAPKDVSIILEPPSTHVLRVCGH